VDTGPCRVQPHASGPGTLSATPHSAATSRACGRSDCSSRRAATGSGAEKSRVKILSPGLDTPPRLREMLTTMGYTHDPALLAPAAALVPDAFVDAITLAGTVEDVAAKVVRLVQQGITHVMIYPISPDGDVELVIHSFARDVVPRVQEEL
jgi:alkanesulfonate monooxygenase SsuD/methylene tetrahydromethanopterin reductase-like flavin-dependent oxidoreductase (luciferase family)